MAVSVEWHLGRAIRMHSCSYAARGARHLCELETLRARALPTRECERPNLRYCARWLALIPAPGPLHLLRCCRSNYGGHLKQPTACQSGLQSLHLPTAVPCAQQHVGQAKCLGASGVFHRCVVREFVASTRARPGACACIRGAERANAHGAVQGGVSHGYCLE